MKLYGISNGVSCYKESVQFGDSFITSLFASFGEICGTAMDFVRPSITVIKIAKTPFDSLTLQLSCVSFIHN